MSKSLTLEKYSLGVGDRFAHQAGAQLRACILAAEHGTDVIPVWNKSNREHATIGSEPATTRAAADAAVKALRWQRPYHVDADHIRLETVDRFVPHSDFYTIDVADSIGKRADSAALKAFGNRHSDLVGSISLPDIDRPSPSSPAQIATCAGNDLLVVHGGDKIYRHGAQSNSEGDFIKEGSISEG